MAALAIGLLGHGGVVGLIAESAIALAVASVFLAVWVRERRARRDGASKGPARLRDDEPR